MHVNFTRSLCYICCILLCTGCARDRIDPYMRAHLEKPDWITGESSKYPPHLYLLGHGVSADLNLAKRQSVNELSSNLNMQIEKYLQQNSSSQIKSTTATIQNFSSANISKQPLMQNREFAETWQDPASKAYHVLAAIDRVKVGEDLLDEIYQLDEKNQRIMKKAQQQPDILQRIAFANMAIEKQQRRHQLQLILEIIKYSRYR